MIDMVKLSDGTEIPVYYDFNEHFPSLPVHNQGQNPVCWYETRATMIEAFKRMLEGQSIHLAPTQLRHVDDGWAVSHWTDQRSNGFGELGKMTYVGGDYLTNLEPYKNLSIPEAIAKALWTNGVVEGGLKCRQSLGRMWEHPARYPGWNAHKRAFVEIPVLHTLKGDLEAVKQNNYAHSVIYVGYRLIVMNGSIRGIDILVQNSWGKTFGLNGRVYVGLDLVSDGAAQPGFIHRWNDFQANDLKMPPVRVK